VIEEIFRENSVSTPLSFKKNRTMLPTSARVPPSRALCGRGPVAYVSTTTRSLHPRKPLPRNDRGPPKLANAEARRSMPTRTRASLGDGGGGEKRKPEIQLPQQPPPVLLPPPASPRLALPLAWRALEAALWPELVITWISDKKREVAA